MKNRSFSFSASRYSIENLNNSMHYSVMEMQQRLHGDNSGSFYLHLDPFLMGVGGDDRYVKLFY